MQEQTRISSGNKAADREAAQGQVRDGLAGNRSGHGKERVSREADVQKGEAFEKPRPMLKAEREFSLPSSFSHIASAIGKSQRTVARHISILKKLGLVAVERRGNLAPLIHFRKEAFGQEELDLCIRLGCHDTAMALIGMCHDNGITGQESNGRSVMTRKTKSPSRRCDDMTPTCHCHDTDMPSGVMTRVMTRACHDRDVPSEGALSPRPWRQRGESRQSYCKSYILNDLECSTFRYLVPLLGLFGRVSMTSILSFQTEPVATSNRPCRDSVMTLSRQCHDTPPSPLPPSQEGGGIKGGGSSLKNLKSESEISDLVHSGNPRRLPVTPNVEKIDCSGGVFPPFPSPISPPLPPEGDSGLFSPEFGEGSFIVGAATESPLPGRDLGDCGEFFPETPESLVPYGDCVESGESSPKTPESLVSYGESEIGCGESVSGSGSSSGFACCSAPSQECPSFAHNWPITSREGQSSGSPLGDDSGASEANSVAFSGMSCENPVEGGVERLGVEGSGGGSGSSQECRSFERNWPITGREDEGSGSPLGAGLGSFKANSGDSVAGCGVVGGVDVVHVLMRVKAPAVKAPASRRQKDELRRLFEEAGGWSRWTEGELLEAAGRFAEWAKGSKKRVDWSLFLRRGPGSWVGSCRGGGGSVGGRSGAAREPGSYLQSGAPVIRSESAGRGGEAADLEASIRHLDRQMVYLEIELRGEERRWREYNEYLVEECGLPPRPKSRRIIEMESRLQEIRQRLSELREKLERCLKE